MNGFENDRNDSLNNRWQIVSAFHLVFIILCGIFCRLFYGNGLGFWLLADDEWWQGIVRLFLDNGWRWECLIKILGIRSSAACDYLCEPFLWRFEFSRKRGPVSHCEEFHQSKAQWCLHDIYKDTPIANIVKMNWLRWAGNTGKMSGNMPAKLP
jgi:hypothetical protein